MNCCCITEVNQKLAAKNLKLCGYAFVMPAFDPVFHIATEWINAQDAPRGQKRNPPAIFVSYCPFCGKKVETAKEEKP